MCDFDERLSRLGYAASDFMLMPSLFEPCGLPQMVAPLYGTLAIARNTGGLHDTVIPLDAASQTGNGILFNDYDAGAIHWAVGEAMRFLDLPADLDKDGIEKAVRENERFSKQMEGKTVVKVIIVPGKMVNFVIK